MDLGTRIKKYEQCSDISLLPRGYIVIRVDGKSFHNFTKGMKKPFDFKLIDAMVGAGIMCSRKMQGFKLGYHQSDEFTFILSDMDSYETEMWFDRRVQKICSITASMFTVYFNQLLGTNDAMFDARAFNVPEEDIPNVIIWRQQDWERNSIQMLAHSIFSSKELYEKSNADIHEMLWSRNLNWAKLPSQLKNGTLILKGGQSVERKFDYNMLAQLLKDQIKV